MTLREFVGQPGSRTFGVVWVGQLVSGLGSGMTRFGLAIWVFLETGSATQLALIVLSSSLPLLLMSPFAGALVDRWDRRVAMMVSDAGAAGGPDDGSAGDIRWCERRRATRPGLAERGGRSQLAPDRLPRRYDDDRAVRPPWLGVAAVGA